MKQRNNRLLSVFLVVSMLLSLMPTAAFAASGKDFTDIPSTAWYYDSVDYVANHGYFNGTGDGNFSPDASMTRAMFVTVLARLDGAKTDDNVSAFDDVASGAWYAGEVAWAVKNGIVSGVGDRLFAPDQAVTRQQMAAFMARYLEYYMTEKKVTFTATGSTAAFSDANQIADYAAKAVTLCRSYGLVTGNTDGSFAPSAQSTRAQVAAVIHRLALLLPTGKPVVVAGGGSFGSSETTASAEAMTASAFIDAAQKSATNVTAAVAAKNTLTASDDLPITNDNVTTLVLDLGAANVGNLTVNAANATIIELKGSGSAATLTINAPKATVNNNVPITGTVTIQAVSHNTLNNKAPVDSIVMEGTGAVNDTSAKPATLIINTDQDVFVKGNTPKIEVKADGAQVTMNPAGDTAPQVDSSASGVKLTVTTDNPVTVSGTVETVEATTEKPALVVNAEVENLTAPGASTLNVGGTGSVGTMTSNRAEVTVADESKLNISKVEMAGGSLKAPDNTVKTVAASGNVSLKATVSIVTAAADTIMTVGEGNSVNTLEAAGNLTLNGAGSINSVDVTAQTGDVNVQVGQNANVTQVTNTGRAAVAAKKNGTDDNLTVLTKAAKPTGVSFNAPASLASQGTITGVTTAMEYSNDNGKTWVVFESTSKALPTGSYQVRVKATADALASEAVFGVIPAIVGVSSAAIQGVPYVGRTLTAVANANATGTLSYVWKAGGNEISGATGKNFTLTDAQIGKKITVTISNYSDATEISSETDKITVDKTALTNLLTKAAVVQQGVALKDNGTTADKVAVGIIFVTNAEKTALEGAVTNANEANVDTATTTAVNAQITALRAAIDTYEKAKKVGTYNHVDTLKAELDALITAANLAKISVVNTAAVNVAPNEKWVLTTDNAAYQTAIDAATTAMSSTNVDELSKGITDLNAAMAVYQKAVRMGAPLDSTALEAAINSAEKNAASVVTSSDGKDKLPSEIWVTEGNLTTYTNVIGIAKNLKATTQQQNNDAVKALNAATTTFNNAKAVGTKDIIAPIVTGVSATEKADHAGTFTIKFTSNEAGTYAYQVGSTEGAWTTPAAVTAGTEISFDYPVTTATAIVYIQVKDSAGNATIVSVALETEASKNAQASINNTKYATLSEAIAAAKSGQTVKLLKDVTDGAGISVIGSSNRTFTIDLGGHTYTVTKDPAGSTNTKSQAFQLLKGSTITMKNGTIGTVDNSNVQMIIQNYCNLTLEDMTLDGTKLNGTYYTMSNNCGNVNIIGSTSIIAHESAGSRAFDVYYWPSNDYAEGVNVTINTTGTITGVIEYDSDNTKGAAAAMHDKAQLLIQNGNFVGNFNVYNCNNNPNISITGGTFSTDPSAFMPDGYSATESGGKYTVAMKTTIANSDIASIGTRGFKTLQGAINAAKNGETVKLVKDVELSGTADKFDGDVFDLSDIILDLDGHTITAPNATNVFGGNNAVIKNGNMVCSNGGSYALFIGDDSVTTDGFTVDGITSTGGINIYNAKNVVLKNMEAKSTTVAGSNYYAVWLDENAFATIESGTYTSASTKTSALLGITSMGDEPHTPSALTITGGTFTVNNDDTLKLTGGDSDAGILSITGGTFSTDPSEYLAADHAAVKNADNTYTVFSTSAVDSADKLKAAMTRNANIKLTADITLPESWVPAGGTVSTTPIPGGGSYPKIDVTTDHPFTGTLDGNNHSITVAVVDNQFSDNAWTGSLFTAVENSTIKNLTVNATITHPSLNANIAGIAGMSNNTTYENVTVNGSNTCYRPSGITCYSVDDTFKGCSVSMDLTAQARAGKMALAGGLAQQISGTKTDEWTMFANCSYSGTITIDGTNQPSSIWAGAMYGGTSYEKVSEATVYFPLKVENCTFSGTLSITKADGVSVAAFGTWATETSGSKTEYFRGLLGRTHKDLAASVIDENGTWNSAKGAATYSK